MTSPKDINDTFKGFYMNLYTSECPATDEDITSFLDDLNLSMLNEKQRQYLDSPLTEAELYAIKAGQGGFTAEFFKCYATELMPLMPQMFTEAF